MKQSNWKNTIRSDYRSILGDAQIEATIKYWQRIISVEKNKAKAQGYREGVKRVIEIIRSGKEYIDYETSAPKMIDIKENRNKNLESLIKFIIQRLSSKVVNKMKF